MVAERAAILSRAHWIGFFALCLLSSSAWLVDNAFPSSLPPSERQGLHDLLLAAVLFSIGSKKIARGSLQAPPWKKVALASVLLLGVPATLAQLTLTSISEVTIAASFALVPVAVLLIVTNSNLTGAARAGSFQLLAPALVGLLGTLFLLPFSAPESWREGSFEAVVLLAVIIAAAAGVWMYKLLRGFAVIEAAAICCLANAVFFLAAFTVSELAAATKNLGARGHWTWSAIAVEVVTAIAFELPQVLLLVWLMRDVAPERFAARYFIVPLLTVFEGFALLRPEITVRAIAGAVLLVLGAWRLMTAKENDEAPRLMLS